MKGFKTKTVKEGDVDVIVSLEDKISKKLPVFYNPLMSMNRDMSVLLLQALCKKEMRIGLPLEGSGVRGVRFLKELSSDAIETISFNDYSENAVGVIKKNIALNGFSSDKRISVSQDDASLFLLRSTGFDYIDIDPFGTPGPFLDAAVKRISRGGILAVTATDTSSFCGTYPHVCQRRYWAKPLHNELMHEVGLRILIRHVQLLGAQYEKSLMPIISYSADHYMRAFFVCEKSKKKADDVLKMHKYLLYCPQCMDRMYSSFNYGKCSCGNCFDYSGPLFSGPFADKAVVGKMLALSDGRAKKLLSSIYGELDLSEVPFLDVHKICKHYKLGNVPKFEPILKKVHGVRTHFSDTGIRTKKDIAFVVKAIRGIKR